MFKDLGYNSVLLDVQWFIKTTFYLFVIWELLLTPKPVLGSAKATELRFWVKKSGYLAV